MVHLHLHLPFIVPPYLCLSTFPLEYMWLAYMLQLSAGTLAGRQLVSSNKKEREKLCGGAWGTRQL